MSELWQRARDMGELTEGDVHALLGDASRIGEVMVELVRAMAFAIVWTKWAVRLRSDA